MNQRLSDVLGPVLEKYVKKTVRLTAVEKALTTKEKLSKDIDDLIHTMAWDMSSPNRKPGEILFNRRGNLVVVVIDHHLYVMTLEYTGQI